MNHLEYALKTVKRQPKKRHHASKHYKKYEMTGSVKLDLENPDHNVMCELAKQWFNSWDSDVFVREMTDNYLSLDTHKKRDDFLDYKYHYFAKTVPNWLDLITPTVFKVQFHYIIPHFFKQWLKELDIEKNTISTGKLENQILNLFTIKKLKLQQIFKALEFETFESTIKAALKRMVKKGLLVVEKSKYNELYYSVAGGVCKAENGKFYFEKGNKK